MSSTKCLSSISMFSFFPPQLSQSDNLCLVRITPREDLFNSHLTPLNGSTLVLMVKQCLAKRKRRLIEQIK